MEKIQDDDVCPQAGNSRQSMGLALISAAMSLPMAGQALAESAPDRALISVKCLDYLDSQPAEDRIKVKALALKLSAPISGEWAIGVGLTTDGISGASPAYHSSSLKKMHERRKAGDADLTRYFENGSLTFGVNASSESDYLSRGLALQGSRASEDRNTTWTTGISLSDDTINPNNKLVDHEKKQVADLLLGLTQVLTSDDIVQLNLGIARGSGYFSDPYKVLDKRPRARNNHTVLIRWNHHLESTQGSARLSYRYFSDSWNIKAHTLGLEYAQPFARGWTFTPMLRIYSQSAASFYVDADPSSYPFPPNPPDDALYYSEDQRLSAFGGHTIGLKLVRQFNEGWLFDIKIEEYTQRASWHLFGRGSPNLQPFYARSIQLGVTHQF